MMYDRALQIDPNDANIYFNKGKFKLKKTIKEIR